MTGLAKAGVGTVPAGAAMYGILLFVQTMVPQVSEVRSWLLLGGMIVLGAGLYGVATLVFNRDNLLVFRRLVVDVATSKGGGEGSA
jgi:hypothetical protein